MSSRSEKLNSVLPSMKLDILRRHNDIMKILAEVGHILEMRYDNTLKIHPKIMEVLINSVETNMGLLIVTGEILEGKVSWNEIVSDLSDFLKNEFTLKSGWLLSQYLIDDREFCRHYMKLVYMTEDYMKSDYSLTKKCLIRKKDGHFKEISRYNYSDEFGK